MRDAFDVLGFEPSFNIELADLDRRQRELLAELHPNRAPNTEPHHVTGALFAKQGEINEACGQLRDPLTRAELLLQRRNEPVTGLQSPALLSRVFEQRELLEQALTREDNTALADCVRAALTRQSELVGTLAAYFSAETAQNMPQTTHIAAILEELKYLNKLVKRGEQALDDFD